MRSYRIRFTSIVSIIGLLLASVLSMHAQGITTAAMSGLVTEADGKPVAGAAVTILHEPSGTRAVATTRANGQYNATGLRVGGPYTVSIKAQGLVAEPQKDVFLTLTQDETVNFTVSSEVVVLDAFHVTEDRNALFDGSRMGTGTSYSASEITAIPSIRHDVQDIANLDPRISLTINTSTGEFAVSAQGQNSRYNSFLIDGMQSNDPFGLNANGFSSTRSPIPLDSLAGINIELNPYDVTRTGFTGALINAVTKSGTNEFHGAFYGYYMDQNLRGKNPGTGPTDPYKGKRETYRDHTVGFNVGGPLVKDKLFFFIAFEDYQKTAAPTNAQQIFQPNDADIAAITAAAKEWGYDAGTSVGALTQSAQKTYLAKIDWNISDDQRATFTYRRVDGSFANPADYNGSTYTSFSNHWYQANRVSDNFSLQLNSTWTSDFRTDAGFAYIKYNGTATPNGAPFPEVYVNGIAGTNLVTGQAVTGQVDLGRNYSYQYNSLNTRNRNGHLYGEYSLGAHTLKIGGDLDSTHSIDEFVQYYYGRYAFASVADFAAGKANYLRYNQAAPGFSLDDSTADYSLTNLGALVQDTWKPNSKLTIIGGVRFDYPYLNKKPIYLPTFKDTWGFTNNTTGSGNYTVSPRVGFNVDLPFERHTQVRGGIGLFQGTNPAVWIANAFTTNGSLNSVTKGSSTTSTVSPTPDKTYTFNADPLYVQTLPPPSVPTPDINLIDPSFRTPIYWKSNLAFDHTLPWLGIVATAEASFMKVEKSILLQSLNLNKTGTGPDGRDLYSGKVHSNYGSVLELGNTSKGGGEAYTLSLVRPMKKSWSASIAYTHSHTTEVQAMTSSVAFSSFNYRASVNPNDNIARNSYYATPDKFVISAAKQFNFFGIKGAETTLSAVFRAQTGHTYSWVFASDVNGDGTNGNDAFYVPTGPDDAKVTWADATQKANFFDFVDHSQLKNYKGQIVSPYSAYNPWQKTIDLHFEQSIPIHGPVKLSVYLDCLNFANLFNKDWGIVDGLDFGTGYNGYNRKVASATVANGQYAYTFTSSTLSSQPTFIDLSRWQFQIGAKLQF